MVATTSFLAFGLLSGFAYLAWTKKRELLCYGLGGIGLAFFLEGIRLMMPEGNGFATFLDVLHHIALGVGGAFLAYVSAIEGWKYYRIWKQRRHDAALAFRAKIAAARFEPSDASTKDETAARAPIGKKAGA